MASSFWSSKRVLVAGGAGFLGSYLTELLVEEGAQVLVVDNLARGRPGNLEQVRDKISFVQTDLRHLDQCKRLCAGRDVVLNLAAPAFGVEYSSAHHGEMLTDTVLIGFCLLEAARLQGVRRFLVVSSSCVYPDDAGVPTKEEEGFRGLPESANIGYGWGKRLVELQGQFFAKEFGMEVAIARPFNAYGPREPLEDAKAHVIPALIRKILDGDDPVVVWGSGNQTRSFVHCRDVALGLKLVAEHYAVADPVNVGHDHEITINELVDRILKATSRRPQVIFDASKPEGASRKSADVTKLRRVTGGFSPRITLDEGLPETIGYFQKVSYATNSDK